MTSFQSSPKAFAAFEWLIAWRYLKARRSEGGIAAMTWISLIGIALAVAALIITLAVRTGFRNEFVNTILGANAHATIYQIPTYNDENQLEYGINDFDAKLARLRGVPGVTRAAGIIRAEVLAAHKERNTGVQIYGETLDDLKTLPLVANPEAQSGIIENFPAGVAIGQGVADRLRLDLGDPIDLISPNGIKTAFGVTPRISSYPVTYIFKVGRFDIDGTRIYMPRNEAQRFFEREGRVDQLEVMVEDPENIANLLPALEEAYGAGVFIETWKDNAGAFLRALELEDSVMFIILATLVLIATMNIVSGLIMLVKNKGRDVGIMRTIGLSEGSILRVFFLCGSLIGIAGTFLGVICGCLFVIYIDPIFDAINFMAGGGVWDPSIRYLSTLPAELRSEDVIKAMSLSLGLSFVITIFPARRAARMNPVEALRYE